MKKEKSYEEIIIDLMNSIDKKLSLLCGELIKEKESSIKKTGSEVS